MFLSDDSTARSLINILNSKSVLRGVQTPGTTAPVIVEDAHIAQAQHLCRRGGGGGDGEPSAVAATIRHRPILA